MASHRPDWSVLLIGGPSGVGKTSVARQLGLRLGIAWLQVDDLRLALQYSDASLPEGTEALHFFTRTPDVWRLTPERLRDGLIGVGQVMAAAIEIVVASHVDTKAPVVIEGDGILPGLFARPLVRERWLAGQVAGVFLRESDEREMLANMGMRGRGMAGRSDADVRTEARAKMLYGQWLADEARRYGLPVLDARPWDTLAERILAATTETRTLA